MAAPETTVVICKWKKTAEGWRLWVRGRPKVYGEGQTYEEAQEALIDSVMTHARDLDAVIPVVPEYDPPLPISAALEQYLTPELFVICGDEPFELERGSSTNALYEGEPCVSCGARSGPRTSEPLRIAEGAWSNGGGFVRGKACTYVFSEAFLSLLTPEEVQRFIFAPVLCPKRARGRQFLELQASEAVPFVGVKGFDTEGWQCSTCHRRVWSVDEPVVQTGTDRLTEFVCRNDLPDPLPSCFPVGGSRSPELCMTRARWDEIRGHKYARGIMSTHLGVISAECCEREPRLRDGPGHCEWCSKWPEPRNMAGNTQRCWSPSLKREGFADCDITSLDWLRPAEAAGTIQITRKTVGLEQMKELIINRRERQPLEIISFRCAKCWRLGQVYVRGREVTLRWF